MLTSPEAVIAILGMALVTIAVKASGLLLADRLPRDGFAAAGLLPPDRLTRDGVAAGWQRHIPGAMPVGLVAPALVTGSMAEVVAAAATSAIFILSKNLFAAMAGSVLTVYLMRPWLRA